MNFAYYLKDLFRLSLPIIAGQMGQMLIVAGDVFMASQYSTKSVASIGVANGFINPILYFGVGLTLGISPIIAKKRGQSESCEKDLSSVLVYSLIMGLLLGACIFYLRDFISSFGIEASLVTSIEDYMQIISFSIPFAVIFHGLKEYLQGFEKVFIPNLIAIIAVILNLGINYLFIFGLGSFKGFGEIGLAYASLGVRLFMAIVILIYCLRVFKLGNISKSFIQENFRLGFPVALMFFLEVLAFSMVSILSGLVDVISAATNNIVMTVASVTFMIPLSISSAVAVKVGHSYGKKLKSEILQWIFASFALGGLFTIISLIMYLIFPEFLMQLLSNDVEVIYLGVQIFFIVAVFQISDGAQVLLSGILRGLQETRLPSISIFVGYWLVGIPIGAYLTFVLKIGVHGLWIGLAISLSLVAIALLIFTRNKLKRV